MATDMFRDFGVIKIRSFPLSWLITARVTRLVPHVEQDLLILPDHPSSPAVFNVVDVA